VSKKGDSNRERLSGNYGKHYRWGEARRQKRLGIPCLIAPYYQAVD
jgi:hypothetical protein